MGISIFLPLAHHRRRFVFSTPQVAEGREEEEQLLEAVREALGAKHVIRVCSSYEQAS